MKVIEDTGGIVEEPKWSLLLTDEMEQSASAEHWRVITTEMRERDILSGSNAHAIQRLVLAYIMFDRCSREVAEHGAVTKPKRGNPKAIARLNPFYTAMREAGSDCERLEAELSLSPRRRTGAGKVARNARRATAADQFLKPVKK